MASDKGGACDLMETMGTSESVSDIWSGLTLVKTDPGAREESYSGGMRLLTQELLLLQIFVQGPCWFWIFWSGLMTVKDVHVPDQIPGRGYALWLRRELERQRINVAIDR